MSTNYSGAAANIANNLPSALPISSSTAANPTVIASLGAHNLLTGDSVNVYDHQTNTGANGQWPITVIDSTHFSIPVDTHSGSPGGATGHFQSLAVGPTGPIPSDGDDDAVVSVNLQLQRLADQTAFLGLASGYTKIGGKVILRNGFGPGNTWGAILAASLTSGTWNAFSCLTPLGVQGFDEGRLSPTVLGTGGNPMAVAVDGFEVFDLAEVELECDCDTSVPFDYLGLFYAFTLPGTPPPSVLSSFTLAEGSAAVIGSSATRIRCSTLIPNPGTGILWIAPAYYSVAGGTTTAQLRDATRLVFTAHRLTNVKQ